MHNVAHSSLLNVLSTHSLLLNTIIKNCPFLQSSQLLYTLLYHLEDRATHHVQAIINGLYKACQDEETAVTDQVGKLKGA